MKFGIPITLVILVLLSCNKDEPTLSIENEDYYDCDNFFDNGDYTSFCTINTDIVNISSETIDGGGTVCRYIIPPLDFDLQSESAVSFTSLQTSAQAILSYNSLKATSEDSAATDSLFFHTPTTVNGYEGFIGEGRYANYSKSVIVRYKNVLVTTRALYYKDWYDENPCNYETDQLITLMSAVLDNI